MGILSILQVKNVLATYCCITNCPPQLLASSNIYDLTVSVGKESGQGLAGSCGSGSLPKASVKVSAKPSSAFQGSTRKGSALKLCYRLLAGSSSLWAFGLKVSAPHWLLVQPPFVPRHVGLSTGQLTTWQLLSSEQGRQEEPEEKRGCRLEVMIFYNLTLEVTSYPFCSVLLV